MTFNELHKTLSTDEQYVLAERAAIIEYEANQPRDVAEAAAMAEWLDAHTQQP